jgi:hypothetical protein
VIRAAGPRARGGLAAAAGSGLTVRSALANPYGHYIMLMDKYYVLSFIT